MDIHNNIDGKGLKATNFADGTADTDLATVGQLGGGGSTVYGGIYYDIFTVLTPSSGLQRLDTITTFTNDSGNQNVTIPNYPSTVSITSFADNGSGGTTCTVIGHGLAENDTLQFSFNGISVHRIFNITTNTFDIGTAYTASPTSATANIYTVLRTTGSGLYLINFSAYISHSYGAANYTTIKFFLYANGESLPFSYSYIGLGEHNSEKTISRTHYIKSDYENNSFGCRLEIYVDGTNVNSRFFLNQANFQVLRV